MKLLQLNIWNGRLLKAALNLIEKEQPDIITLQEVYSSEIRTRTHDFLASFERIRDVFPSYQSYFSPRLDFPVFDKKVQYGNALLSKFPLSNAETIVVRGEFHSYQKAEDYAANEGQKECFNLQRVQVKIEGSKSCCLINYHGYWEPNEFGTDATIPVMEKVAEIIKASSKPLILSGDLNVVAESPAMKPVHALLRDLTAEYEFQSSMTQFAKLPNVAPDHICVSDGIEVEKFAVLDDVVSDHKALVLEFELG